MNDMFNQITKEFICNYLSNFSEKFRAGCYFSESLFILIVIIAFAILLTIFANSIDK